MANPLDRERPTDRPRTSETPRPDAGAGPVESATGREDGDESPLRRSVIEMLKTCYDPEIPIDIYELGLIYDVRVDEQACVTVTMTLTTPMCPVAEILPGEVQAKVASVPGVAGADIDLVWEPPWDPSMMSEAARLQLGF